MGHSSPIFFVKPAVRVHFEEKEVRIMSTSLLSQVKNFLQDTTAEGLRVKLLCVSEREQTFTRMWQLAGPQCLIFAILFSLFPLSFLRTFGGYFLANMSSLAFLVMWKQQQMCRSNNFKEEYTFLYACQTWVEKKHLTPTIIKFQVSIQQ